MASVVFVFPGQGAQKVGMCAAFFNGFKSGIETVEEIEDSISFKISSIINNGPVEELLKTENAQLAIFTVSMVCLRVMEKEYGIVPQKDVMYVSGHSLGEYTALCASSSISLKDASRLVKFRGAVMSKAYTSDDGAMVAILGMEIEEIEKYIADYQQGRNLCVIANDNMPGQVVLSGHSSAVKAVCDSAVNNGAKRAIKLSISGPFHSPLMASAAIELDKFISQEIKFSPPCVPIIMNANAKPVSSETEIHDLLVSQITGKVRWREIMIFLKDSGVDVIVEIGPGRVLSGIAKRMFPDINSYSIETVSEMEDVMKKISNFEVGK